VEIDHCPKLLLQSMDVNACPKLENLSIVRSCWTGLAKVALTQNLQELRIHSSSLRETMLNEVSHCVFELELNKGPNEVHLRTKRQVPQLQGGYLGVLTLSNLSLKNSKILSTLSGLQELCIDEVQLLDGETLCLESCINMEILYIRGGNVQTISGIGHATLKRLVLYSMKNLRDLPDVNVETLDWLGIVKCKRCDTSIFGFAVVSVAHVIGHRYIILAGGGCQPGC
jgi:hypothetical protein